MTARGIVQRGCLASSPSGAAASKPMNARIPKTIPLKTPEKSLEASGFTFSGLNACRFSWSKFERSIQSERPRKIAISNAPSTMPARVERRTSRYVRTKTISGGGEDPPRPADVPPDLVLDDVIGRPREDEEEERGDERCEEHEAPPREETRVRPERGAHVRVEAARRRHLLRELADRARHERAGDRGEEHGERKRLPGERHRNEEREGHRRRGRHVRDRLEERLREPDRMLAQVVEGAGGLRGLRLHVILLRYPGSQDCSVPWRS